MKPFDGNEYRKRVMTRLLEDFSLADPQTGDPFLVVDVEPDDGPAAVAKRLDDVVAFWQKDRNHPKYKGITAQLVGRREQYAFVLTDPAAHAAAVRRVHGARAASDAAAVAALDRLAGLLVQRHQGIPRSRVAALSSIAADEGMSGETFAAWLARHRVVEDAAAHGAVPWEQSIRRQVRTGLDELARTDPSSAGRYRTLLTFLGVGPRAGEAELRAAHARLTERNRSRSRDRVMTLTEDLLAQVSTRLLAPGGLAAYTASLRSDARDGLRDDLRRLAVLTGALPAAELEAMVARIVGLGWGFSAAEARQVVLDAAHDVHLAVEVGGSVDLVVCPDCGRPQPAGESERCSYCRADLYLSCPSCATRIPAASDVCPSCDAPLALWHAAAAVVPQARASLDAGRPAEADVLVRRALDALGTNVVPVPLRAVESAVADVLGRAARSWQDLHRHLLRGELWAAADAAGWLAHAAIDVPDSTGGPSGSADAEAAERRPAGSDGARGGSVGSSGGPSGSFRGPDGRRTAAEWVQELAQQQEDVASAVQAVAALPPEEAGAALEALQRAHPDAPPVREALAGIPLAAPVDVSLDLAADGATVAWVAASGASRSVRYRVERHIVWPEPGRTTVGTTTSTHLEDAAVPAGTTVRYTVTAVDGDRSSSPVDAGAPRFVRRDVEVLRVAERDGDVELSWPMLGLGVADVVLERDVDPASGLTMPTRRIRPAPGGRHVDEDVSTGVPYRYRLSLTYRTPEGELVRTPGRTAEITLQAPPRAVAEMWASTDDAGRTTVAFQTPPAGVVRVYAAPGERVPLAGFTSGTVAELDAAADGARLVGEGRRRVVDTGSRGQVTYRAVTVVDPRVVAGASLAHSAVARPSNLRVLSDDGRVVRLAFDLPAGVTEAVLRWRRDRYPSSSAEAGTVEAGAGGGKITNMKLEIDGAFEIAAPDDGRPLFVTVYGVIRPPGGGPGVPAAVGAPIEARAAASLSVGYVVRFGGVLRKKLEVDVAEAAGRPLPALRLVWLTPDAPPATAQTLLEYAGGEPSTTLRMDGDDLPRGLFMVRVVPAAGPSAAVSVADPPESSRRLSR